MKKISALLSLLIGALSVVAVAQSPRGSSSRDIVIDSCHMWRNDYYDREISAQDAGLIMAMNLREGDSIQKGDLMAQLDTTESEMRRDVAQFRKNKAEVEADNTIRTEFAKSKSDVSTQRYHRAVEANRKAGKMVFPEEELTERELEMKQAALQIKNEEFNTQLAGLEVNVQNAEVEASNKVIERHQIVAPFSGQVDKVYRKANEWAQAGEPILRLVRYDEMIVKGRVSAKDYDPHELENRTVTIEVPFARGRSASLEGKVVRIGSEAIGAHDTFEVIAQVANRRIGSGKNGRWILLHGPQVKMTIHLD